MVLENNFLCVFSHCKAMGVNDPRGVVIFYHRGMICRIYVELHMALLHSKYTSFGLQFQRRFIHVFPLIAYCSNDAPGAWPVWTPGARLAGFTKRSSIHCYTQNMKAFGRLWFRRSFFFHCKAIVVVPFFFLSQGHDLQNLNKAQHNKFAY